LTGLKTAASRTVFGPSVAARKLSYFGCELLSLVSVPAAMGAFFLHFSSISFLWKFSVFCWFDGASFEIFLLRKFIALACFLCVFVLARPWRMVR
jgi:hypothetical protein